MMEFPAEVFPYPRIGSSGADLRTAAALGIEPVGVFGRYLFSAAVNFQNRE
jgi:hypothetical protein